MILLHPLESLDIVLIHRGRDEENSFEAVIQYKNIANIKGKWDVLVEAAGGIDNTFKDHIKDFIKLV
ncbi:MAG: hypothetical protein ACOX6Q_03195 [Candidatus Dojkabacteria bacterium]